MKKIAVLVFVCLALVGCHIPSLSGLNLDGCITTCKDKLDAACGQPGESMCFSFVKSCFDGAAQCADMCTGCDMRGDCPGGMSEDECALGCAHVAKACGDQIPDCVSSAESDLIQLCLDPLLTCTAECIKETEIQLGAK